MRTGGWIGLRKAINSVIRAVIIKIALSRKKDIVGRGQDKEQIRKDLLRILEGFERQGWELIALQHMHLPEIKWFDPPEKLSNSEWFRILKTWLTDPAKVLSPVIPAEKLGEIRLKLKEGKEKLSFLGSIYFSLWLQKTRSQHSRICIVSFAEHSFTSEDLEKRFGRGEYSVLFKDPGVILSVLKAQSERKE